MSEPNGMINNTSAMEARTIKIERYLRLIAECRGNISAIAREEGIRRRDCKDYIDRNKELAEALDDWRQGIVDKAEDNIFADVEKGDTASSKMVVATLGKDRGWVPREEKTGRDGEPLLPPVIQFAPYEEKPEALPQEESQPQESANVAND